MKETPVEPHTVLVTGASRGIGLEFARQYAKDGWTVHACSRTAPQSAELLKLAEAYPRTVLLHAMDVTNAASVDAVATHLKHEIIDVVINNAGSRGGADAEGPLPTVTVEAMVAAFQTNVVGPLLVSRAFSDALARSKLRLLVAIGDDACSVAEPGTGGLIPYKCSKAALHMLIKTLAAELAPRHVCALVVTPGEVRTELSGAVDAVLSVDESVGRMRDVILRDGAKMHQSGTAFQTITLFRSKSCQERTCPC